MVSSSVLGIPKVKDRSASAHFEESGVRLVKELMGQWYMETA